jgi:probable F420-dependent oxidoreductase
VIGPVKTSIRGSRGSSPAADTVGGPVGEREKRRRAGPEPARRPGRATRAATRDGGRGAGGAAGGRGVALNGPCGSHPCSADSVRTSRVTAREDLLRVDQPRRGLGEKLRLMEIGVTYPQIELHGDPSAVGRFGRAVEDLGFDHLLAYEHVLGAVHADRSPPLPGPYTEHDPFHDPFVMFAYLAGITDRIRFTTGILVLPQRQTALVARQAADVDLLSGGRLRLGVGIGWNYVEFEALGQDFHTRGARQEEQIELLRRLFTEPVVTFSGRFDRVDRAALMPKPAGSIPIWLGGSGEKAFDRAARLADGFIFFGGGVETTEVWTRLRERVARVGRSVDEFGGDYVALSGGDVGELTREIEAWRNAGGTHVSVVTMGLGLDSVDAHIDYISSLSGRLGLS